MDVNGARMVPRRALLHETLLRFIIARNKSPLVAKWPSARSVAAAPCLVRPWRTMGANESQAIYPEEVIEDQLGSEHSLSRTFSPPPSAPLSEAEPEDSSLSDGKTTSEMIDLADDSAGQHLADAAECLRVAKLLDYHYHTVVLSRSDARTPRSLSRRLMGERMTADKLPCQGAERCGPA